jgi:hypothetical protein
MCDVWKEEGFGWEYFYVGHPVVLVANPEENTPFGKY